MGDLMVCVRIFSPRTSGDRIFCPEIQSYCMAGISLQDFSCAQNQTSGCFLPEITHPPPLPQKSNRRPLISSLHMIGHISVLHNYCETH